MLFRSKWFADKEIDHAVVIHALYGSIQPRVEHTVLYGNTVKGWSLFPGKPAIHEIDGVQTIGYACNADGIGNNAE